jgi:hypothetical protein
MLFDDMTCVRIDRANQLVDAHVKRHVSINIRLKKTMKAVPLTIKHQRQ